MSLRRDSNFAELDFQVVQNKIARKNPKGKPPTKSVPLNIALKLGFKIGKYGSEDGATAAVRKFKTLYRHMKESTVRGFKSTYQEELKKATRQSRTMTKALPEKKKRPSIDAWSY